MERFETDAVADSRGVVHIAVGEPGKRVHVTLCEAVEPKAPPDGMLLGDYIASLGANLPGNPDLTAAAFDRDEIYDRGWRAK